MTDVRRMADPGSHRGAALVACVIALLIIQLVVVTAVLNTGRDHELSARQTEAVRAMYAAESGIQLGLREMAIGFDEDGDGTVGGISDDGNEANDLLINGSQVAVSRTDVGAQAELAALGRSGVARRAVTATVVLPPGYGLPYVTGRVRATAAPRTIAFGRILTNPVVVCTVQYDNNTAPVVVRINNVTSTSFDIRLQNPGDVTAPVDDVVHYIVMEAGAHVVDGRRFEAQRVLVTGTDRRGNWDGQDEFYLHAYTDPVVIGQVMTENDPDWSVFWARGKKEKDPPEEDDFGVGKHVAEDPNRNRVPEDVGFIVFESVHGEIGEILTDARLSDEDIEGYDDGPPFAAPFNASFPTPPEVVLVSSAGMQEKEGSWALLYGVPAADTDDAFLFVDEDQLRDSERKHKTEHAAVIAFQVASGQPQVVAWVESAGVP